MPSQEEFDRAFAVIRDSLPQHWWSMYQACVAEGFTTEQAFELVKTYVGASCRLSFPARD